MPPPHLISKTFGGNPKKQFPDSPEQNYVTIVL